jgi:hypothetical protein
MKPHRVRMAHDLIIRYGLHKHLQVGRHRACRRGAHPPASHACSDACDAGARRPTPQRQPLPTVAATLSSAYGAQVNARVRDPGGLRCCRWPAPRLPQQHPETPTLCCLPPQIFAPAPATRKDFLLFHDEDYVDAIERLSEPAVSAGAQAGMPLAPGSQAGAHQRLPTAKALVTCHLAMRRASPDTPPYRRRCNNPCCAGRP